MTDQMPGPSNLARDIDVLVLGEINPDVIVRSTDPRPQFGQVERVVESVDLTVGSSSVIFACGVVKLGLRVAFVGLVGNDAMGRFMLEEMRARGIDTVGCRTVESVPTGATVILTDGRDRAILTALGTVPLLRDEDVPAALLARARHVHVGSAFLLDALRPNLAERFAAVRRDGATTSLDCNWDPRETWDGGLAEILQHTDVFLPNAAEVTRIAGLDTVETAALALAAAGPRIVAVKCGADGALAAEPNGMLTRVPAIAMDVVDATGAGDSFDAGFLVAWLDGRPTGECLALGVACGSLSTRMVGGVAAQPTLAEAEAVAREAGLLE